MATSMAIGARTGESRGESGSRNFMNSEYVCVTSQEETVLETYFVMISRFNFERAKEQCEKERDVKSAGGGGANWCEFMTLLSRLSMAESSYYSLNFVDRLWLVKRETQMVPHINILVFLKHFYKLRQVKVQQLSSVYETLLYEFKKVHEVYQFRRGGTDFSWERKMAELLSSVMEYVSARKEMIGFYQSFHSSDGCLIDCVCNSQTLQTIKDRHSECFQNPFMKPVQQSFWSEIDVLSHILKAHVGMSDWQFLPSLFSLQNAQNKLYSWPGLNPPRVQIHSSLSGTSRSPLSSRSRSSSPHPFLYQWLCSFLSTVLSKFTLYFHDILHSNGVLNDTKLLTQKFKTDFSHLFSILLKQAPPNSCVCLMFDSNASELFRDGPQYQPALTNKTDRPKLTGLNSYPVMMSLPQDYNFLPHKANIVSMIMSHSTAISPGVSTQLDTKLHCTYHLAQVDTHVTMVTIVSAIRTKGHEALVSLLMEIVNQLRLQHIIQALNVK